MTARMENNFQTAAGIIQKYRMKILLPGVNIRKSELLLFDINRTQSENDSFMFPFRSKPFFLFLLLTSLHLDFRSIVNSFRGYPRPFFRA